MENKNSVGKFIVFEGLDCSGKSTQLKLLSNWLTKMDIDHVNTFEPNDPKIRNLLLMDESVEVDKVAELFLFMADRAQHVNKIILPALNSGKWVLCDRYTWSTKAYQGYGKNLSLDMINDLNIYSTNALQPDLTIFLEIDLSTMVKRKRHKKDKFESMSFDFYMSVLNGYEEIINVNSMFNLDKILSLKGNIFSTDIHHKIVYNVYNKFLGFSQCY